MDPGSPFEVVHGARFTLLNGSRAMVHLFLLFSTAKSMYYFLGVTISPPWNIHPPIKAKLVGYGGKELKSLPQKLKPIF